MGNNLEKLGLIPHEVSRLMPWYQSRKALREGPAAYQVVGGVMAYQAYDG